jgi:hypothetical protein
LSEDFGLERGLKQGSIFAPHLFNIFVGAAVMAFKKRLDGEGIKLRVRRNGNIFDLSQFKAKTLVEVLFVVELLFADDAVLMGASEKELQRILDIFVEVLEAYGQEISIKKTEVMRVGEGPPPRITVNGHLLAVVTQFKYVGGMEDNSASMDLEIKTRESRMVGAYVTFRHGIFENHLLNLRTRLRFFVALVLSVGSYGCESWNCTDAHLHKLDGFFYRSLLKICGYTWADKVSFVALIAEAARMGVSLVPFEILVRKRQLQYAGRIVRMADDNFLRGVFHAELWFGYRLSGKPETALRHSLSAALESFHIPVKASPRSTTGGDEVDSWASVDEAGSSPPHDGWLERAKDRREWDKAVRAGADVAMEEWTARRVLRSKKAAERGAASREEDAGAGAGVVVDVTPSRSVKRRRVAPARHTSVLRSGVTRYPIDETLLREPWRVASKRGKGERRKECYDDNVRSTRVPLSRVRRYLIQAKLSDSI